MIHPIQAAIRERPMGAYQVLVVALCVLINAIDGFDILALSFAAPVIVREWGLTPGQTGFVFSANLAGIGTGAFVFSYVADLIGRRPVILGGTVLMSIGMIATSTVDSAGSLALCRFLTGLGIGAMVATAGTLAIEYSAARWRTVSVAAVVIGFPVGGALGGFAAAWLLGEFGWRAIFLFGGALTVVLLPVLVWRLPESIEFLVDRQPRDALARINRYAGRVGLAPLASLPAATMPVTASSQFLELWRGAQRRATLRLVAIYPMFMFTFYYFINWSTKIASERGLTDTAAIAMSSLVNLGGIAGGITFGMVAARLSLPKLVATLTVLMSIGIAAFGILPVDVVVLNAACLVLGFCLWGASATIYSVIALSYPARVRASGIGTIVTVGRAGSALGPWAAGVLRGTGLEWSQVSLLLAVPGVLAALLILTLRPDSYSAAPSRSDGAAGDEPSGPAGAGQRA